MSRGVRLLAIGAGVLVLIAGGGVLLLSFFSSRDDPGVGADAAPGRQTNSAAGYPTFGEARTAPIRRDRSELSKAQVLSALRRGNVVLVYGTAQPSPTLIALQDELSGPFEPELAAAGGAVILARHAGASGVTALAWRHAQAAGSGSDPKLRTFAEYWLGRGPSG